MDPQLLTALIAAVSALAGAAIGTVGTLMTARRQHDRTVQAEREKESRARAKQAAETCSSLLAQLAKLKSQAHSILNVADNPADQAVALMRLDDELRTAALYLPSEARAAVDFARTAIADADDIVQGGYFYGHGSSSIASNVVRGTREILAALVRDEPIPGHTVFMKRVAIAIEDLDGQRSDDYRHLDEEYAEEERAWLESHPDAPR